MLAVAVGTVACEVAQEHFIYGKGSAVGYVEFKSGVIPFIIVDIASVNCQHCVREFFIRVAGHVGEAGFGKRFVVVVVKNKLGI